MPVKRGHGGRRATRQHARLGAQRLAALLLRDVERIADRTAGRMQALVPAYARVPRRDLTPVVAANMRNLLEAVRHPETDRRRRQQRDHRRSGRTRALQGITSDEMLQAWWVGLEDMSDEAYAVARALHLGPDVLLDFVQATLKWGGIGMRSAASAHHEAKIRDLGRLAEEQAALRRVATLVAQGARSERLFAAVAEQVAWVFRVPLVSIARYEPGGTATECAGRSDRGDDLFPPGTQWALAHARVLADVRETGGPARADDDERSTVGVPIVVAGEMWGAISVFAADREPLRPETESRLVAFSELVAMAISNANAQAEVERLAEEQAALRRVATMVASECSAEQVLAQVAHEIGRLLAGEAAFVMRYDADLRATTVVGSWGELGDALRVGRRFERDIATEVRELGLCSAVARPIFVDGRLWGTLGAATSRPEPLPAGAEARITEFTELVATAISNIQARSDLAASRARIVAAADEERRRLVRDLHDGSQARLVHTVVTLGLARRALARYGEDVAALLDEPLRQAQWATDEMRELAHGILPSALTHYGLDEGVRSLAKRMSLPVEVDIAVGRLPRVVEATAYFSVAEALNNVAKHAHARRATVTARLAGDTLEVEVADDGVGGARTGGSGLVGLGDRLAAVGGSFRVQSPVGGGTRISASIPIV